MNCAIFMVTFRRDLEFAEYSFRSVDKFCSGFGERIVAVPFQDEEMFRQISEPYGFIVKAFDEWPGKGFVHHEALICEADQWCQNSDSILHLDADCLFTGPVTPEDYMIDGKLVLYRERYESFKQHPNRYGWKECVRLATGITPEWETMCRHPSVYWRSNYKATRDRITLHTGTPCNDYIRSCRNTYPQGFAEFPTLGAVAIEANPAGYYFIEHAHDSPDMRRDKSLNKLKAFWSVGGVEMINDRHPDETARQMMDRILST